MGLLRGVAASGHGADQAFNSKLITMPTLNKIAEHLDMSVTRVKEIGPKLSMDKSCSLDQWRVAYINHLRNTASGRGGDDHQTRLAIARSRESELKGDKIELEMMQATGGLIYSDDVEKAWSSMIMAARSELSASKAKIMDGMRHELEAPLSNESAAAISELIDESINAAFKHLAQPSTGDFDPDAEPGAPELAAAGEDLDD